MVYLKQLYATPFALKELSKIKERYDFKTLSATLDFVIVQFQNRKKIYPSNKNLDNKQTVKKLGRKKGG